MALQLFFLFLDVKDDLGIRRLVQIQVLEEGFSKGLTSRHQFGRLTLFWNGGGWFCTIWCVELFLRVIEGGVRWNCRGRAMRVWGCYRAAVGGEGVRKNCGEFCGSVVWEP
jgi:hypothetical protein